jgi:transposase
MRAAQPQAAPREGQVRSIDAHLAVLAALRLDTGRLPVPRANGDREALRILLVARQEIAEACTAQAGRLRALLLAGDDTDRRAARTTLSGQALAALAGRDLPAQASREQAVRQAEIGRLAGTLGQARRQLMDNRAQLLAIVEDIAPGPTSRYGVGPASAAQAIVSFSHPGRCRSEAAFAALGGTSPIPASSGQTVRHRLNRGGDRALNRAIQASALVRMRSCPPDPRLRRPAHRRGKDRAGNPPLPQAIHRPRALPAPHPVDESSRGPLTNIEASRVTPRSCAAMAALSLASSSVEYATGLPMSSLIWST